MSTTRTPMAMTMVLTADEALELPAFLVTAARTVPCPRNRGKTRPGPPQKPRHITARLHEHLAQMCLESLAKTVRVTIPAVLGAEGCHEDAAPRLLSVCGYLITPATSHLRSCS